jgi:polar amino acid transport system permease protein
MSTAVVRGRGARPTASLSRLAARAALLTFLGVVAALGIADLARRQGTLAVLTSLARWTPLLFQGFLMNVLVSVLAMALGTALGAVLGLAQLSLSRLIAWAARGVTQFFRNAPWLVILFLCVLALPFDASVAGIALPLPAWVKATIGLALPVMGSVSEIVRGAVLSVPGSQWESAESLAFSRRQTLWMIILPQTLKRMLPPWMNTYAILLMATPLISIVGIQDVMTVASGALAAEGKTELMLPMYSMLLAWFYIVAWPISRWTGALERRFAVRG